GADAAFLDVEVGPAVGPRCEWVCVVEQEDRLELRVRRTQDLQAPLFRAAVRSLMWQHLACGVRSRLDRAGDTLPGAPDPIRSDVLLRDEPETGLLFAQDAVLSPVRERASSDLGGVGQ